MRTFRRAATVVLGPALAGFAACGLAVLLADHLSQRVMLALAAGFLLFVLLLRSPQPRHILLFAWAASLTYYRTYVFAAIGDFGPTGPYWMRSDLLLLTLFVWWVVEAAIMKRQAVPIGSPVLPYIAPLLVICFLNSMSADDHGRALTDLVRIVKMAALAWYIRRNVREPEMRWSLCGIGIAVIFQSTVGLIQVTTGKLAPGGLDAGGFLRATGTMVHPNILAPYLLLVTPIFVALAIRGSSRRLQVAAAAVGSAGVVAVVCSMSRAPWLLMAAEIGGVLCLMAWLRYIRLESLAVAVVGGTLLCVVAAIPFAAKLQDRLLSNLNESIEFRNVANNAAWRMFLDHPVLGVGLNHFALALPAYDHSFDDHIDAMDEAVAVNERPMVAVHNFYLLILAETGLLGFAGMLLFVGWSLRSGIRAMRRTSGDLQAISIGMFIGIAGLLIEETADFSLWMDPGLFTFLLLACLLNAAPAMEYEADLRRMGEPELILEGAMA
jgi:O-antigen ligase